MKRIVTLTLIALILVACAPSRASIPLSASVSTRIPPPRPLDIYPTRVENGNLIVQLPAIKRAS